MTSRVLVYTQNAICMISDIEKEWTKRNLSICKTADFEDAVKELKYHTCLQREPNEIRQIYRHTASCLTCCIRYESKGRLRRMWRQIYAPQRQPER